MLAPSRPSAVAIINPVTGVAGESSVLTILHAVARELGVDLQIVETTGPGSATELARRFAPSADILVAVGGDGTVSDVITGSFGQDVVVGILPAGTTDMIAKELRLPHDLDQSARIALGGGVVSRIDIATAGSTTCAHLAGAGYDAEIMQAASAELKRRIRWLAYLPPAIRLINIPAFNATITIDGETRTRKARLVFCALGASVVHRRFRVGEGIDRTDGWIDVCVWSPPNLLATLSCVGWISIGRPGRSRWLRQARGKSITVTADRAVPFQVDGDVVGALPITMEMRDHQVAVYTPQQI